MENQRVKSAQKVHIQWNYKNMTTKQTTKQVRNVNNLLGDACWHVGAHIANQQLYNRPHGSRDMVATDKDTVVLKKSRTLIKYWETVSTT